MRLYLLLGLLALAMLALPGALADDDDAPRGKPVQPDVRLFAHAREVQRDHIGDLVFRVNLTGADVNATDRGLMVEWARVQYAKQADNAVKKINRTANDTSGRAGDAGLGDDMSNVDREYGLKWMQLDVAWSFNATSGVHEFRYTPDGEVLPGYYLFRVRVINQTAEEIVRLTYSREPLLVLAGSGGNIELKVVTVPDFTTQTLYFKVRYSGPFLENPIVYITYTHPILGKVLNDYRVNITGEPMPNGGVLEGNYSFADNSPPLNVIPAGKFTLILHGVDGANHTVVVKTSFEVKSLNLNKNLLNRILSDSGNTTLDLGMLQNVTGMLTLEELNVNPHHKPNLTRLLDKHGDELPPGLLRDIGRYISVEPSEDMRQNLERAYIKFLVNRTDYDDEGNPLGERVRGLRIFYYNETSEQWELVENSYYNTTLGQVVAEVGHFSIYGVFGTNVAPSADAGTDQEVESGATVTFHGIGTDVDSDVVLYEWDFDGDGTYDYSNTTSGEATWTYPADGEYVARLKVTDEEGSTSFDTVTIAVGEVDEGSAIPAPGLALVAGLLLVAALLRRKR